jgi:arylformamidase
MPSHPDTADLATLEREYSPSSCVTDLKALLDQYHERSEAARAQCPGFTTLAYGDDPAERIDFFPAEEPSAPLLIFIHGGYWQELSKREASFPAVDCRRNGLAYAAINYGLAPAATMGQMIERCRMAVAALYANAQQLGFNARAIYISGSSAGAHLAAMTALASWNRYGVDPAALRGAILLSGIYELEPLVRTYINKPLGLTVESARRYSPISRLDRAGAALPPMLVTYGEHETSEFKRQSAQFVTALRRHSIDAELMEIDGRNHFDIAFDLVDERTVLGRAALALIARTYGEPS